MVSPWMVELALISMVSQTSTILRGVKPDGNCSIKFNQFPPSYAMMSALVSTSHVTV